MKKYLAIVDLQNDFIYNEKEGGAMGVGKEKFLPAWNNLKKKIEEFGENNLILTADWHPTNHCSFKKEGGLWPSHCVKSTRGSYFYRELQKYITKDTPIIYKGQNQYKEEYGVDLLEGVKNKNVEVYVTGLCYDYCVSECAKITAEKNPESKIIILKNCSVAIDETKKMNFSKYKNIEVK